MSRSRTATPDGPGTTNDAATARRSPTPSPPADPNSPSPHPTSTTHKGHAFETGTSVPSPNLVRAETVNTHSRTPEHAYAQSTGNSCQPCFHGFPSWEGAGVQPGSIEWPAEGGLDRPTWERLIRFLTAHSPQGADTACLAYYNPIITGDFEAKHVRSGRLGDAQALFDHPDILYTPSNLWPADRSWAVFTDYDLWATKVSGPRPLVEALLADTEIEAVRLPWTS
ncbi:hypothetical protein ACH4S8_03960 [Streptomyces sp. NPDC021080]|uniref:hypothetical protein n=1 Tax=Streptomyces sp. NPDC021080 TaxID=3365110 RepID=UPI0037A53275